MTYIFEDDVEDGFTPWSGTQIIGGGSTTVSNAFAHHGINSGYSVKAAGGIYSNAFKEWFFTLGKKTTLYAQMYVKYAVFPSNNARCPNLVLGDLYGNYQAVGIYNDAGTPKWMLRYYNGGYNNSILANPVPALNTWYGIKLKSVTDDGAGEARMFLNGTEVLTQTGLVNKTAFVGGMDSVQCGIFLTDSTNLDALYWDCVKVSESDIIAETTNNPTVYPTIKVEEANPRMPSTSSIVINQGSRVRTIRHCTPISPWTAT